MAKKASTRTPRSSASSKPRAKTSKTSSTKSASKKKTSKKTTKKTTKKAAKKATKSKSPSLPRVGARVQWRSLPGMVFGKVLAILRSDSSLNGKPIKASKEAPRIKLQSDKGKICVHKPESVRPAPK